MVDEGAMSETAKNCEDAEALAHDTGEDSENQFLTSSEQALIAELTKAGTAASDIGKDELWDLLTSARPSIVHQKRSQVIVLGLHAGLTLQTLGDIFDVTRERIRQIAAHSGVVVSELREQQRDHARRFAARRSDEIFASSVAYPELNLAELAEAHDTDIPTVRRALGHRLLVHESRRSTGAGTMSDADLLAALREWADGAERHTGDAYETWAKKRGIPGRQTVQIRFGSWNGGLRKAGLEHLAVDRGGPRPQVSDAALWASVLEFFRSDSPNFAVVGYERYAQEHGLASAATIRKRLGGWSSVCATVRKLMRYAVDRDGSWAWADEILDIVPGEERRTISTVEDCVASLQRVAARTTGPLTVQMYEDNREPGDLSGNAIQLRCGSWIAGLMAAGLADRMSSFARAKLQREQQA